MTKTYTTKGNSTSKKSRRVEIDLTLTIPIKMVIKGGDLRDLEGDGGGIISDEDSFMDIIRAVSEIEDKTPLLTVICNRSYYPDIYDTTNTFVERYLEGEEGPCEFKVTFFSDDNKKVTKKKAK